MRTVIGSVENLDGKFFAKDAEGNVVELKTGDEITQDMIVFGDENNPASATMKIAMIGDREDMIIEANNEESFDEDLELELGGEEEKISEEDDEVFDEETESGDEKAKDSEGGSDQFAARDGNAVDVNSGLRNAKFKLTSHTFEIKDQFETESELGLNPIARDPYVPSTPNIPTPPTTPPPIAPPPVTPPPSTKPPLSGVLRIDGDATVNEGNIATYKLTIDEAPLVDMKISVTISHIDTDSGDITTETRSLTILGGQTSVSFTVTNNSDNKVEQDEDYLVSISSYETGGLGEVTLANASVTTTILDDVPTLSINDMTVNEADGTMTFTVTLSDSIDENVTFNYATSDKNPIDAQSGKDYTLVNNQGTIIAGQTTTTITVPIIDDYFKESDEEFLVNLTNPSSNATIEDGEGVGTILDTANEVNTTQDIDTVHVQLNGDVTAKEGAGEKLTHTFTIVDKDGSTVNLANGETIDVTLTYSGIASVDGVEDADLTTKTTTFTITGNGGSSYTFENIVAEDYFSEGVEGYTVSIGSITASNTGFENIAIDTANNTSTGKITDDADDKVVDQDVDTVYVQLNGDVTAKEGAGEKLTHTFTIVDKDGSSVNLVNGETIDVTLTYSGIDSVDGIEAADLTTKTTTFTITGNGGSTYTFDNIVAEDYFSEGVEGYTVSIDSITASNTGFENIAIDTANNTSTGKITDDADDKVVDQDVDTLYIKITHNNSVVEGSKLTHTVTLVDKDGVEVVVPADKSIVVNLKYSSTNGVDDSDFTTIIKQVTITNGSSTTFENLTKDDFANEGVENYTVEVDSIVDTNNYYENLDKYSNKTGVDADSQATGEIKDGVVVATSEDAKVYEDALVNDIKQQSAANGEEIAGATISTKSLNLTNVNADSYSVSFDNNSWSTNLKSEGQDITTSIVAGDILGKLADGTVVFKVELDKSAATEYTFTLFKPLDHADADGHNELNLVFGYTVTAGTATISKTFNVAVVDSVPDLDGVTHTHNEDSSASANKLILADEFRPTDGTSSLTIAGEDLTANASSVKINASGIAVTDGSEIGTIVSDGDGGVTFEPKNDYSGTVSVAYTITDSDGDTATSNLVFDTKPKVDFIAPTLNDLEVNEDARDEDKVEDITASALVLDVPNIANLLATGTGANYDDDRSESVGDIIVKGIPDGATLYVDGVAVVLVDDGATNKYTISGFDPSTNVLSIIPPADSDADFTITYNFTVTDTATLSTGEDTDTKDYSIDQKIIVHGVADNVSIDAVLNNITQAEQALNNVSSSWMNVSDIISKSDLTFGDSSDKSEAHLIRIDGLPSGAYYSHSGNLNSSGVDLTGAAGNNTSNMFKGSSSSYYRVIDNGDGTSSLIISAENYLDGAGTEGKLRFPDVDGTFNITVTAVAVEKEFVEAEGSDWYDSVTWDANDGNTAGGTHVDDKIGFEVSEAKNSTITVTKSMDVEVKGVETSEDTEVSFLSKVNITDASDEDFSSIKILTSSLGGATITSGSVTIDGLYTVINDLNDLSSYKLIPPAHSSTDLNLSLEVITTDGTATYTLPIKVTPVAEKVGVDSDGDGSNDLTMNIDHTYAAKGSEDSRFDLGSKFASENGNSFESYWSNEDDSDLTNNTLSQTNSEYTYAKLTAGDSTNLVGAKFIYTDSLGVEHTKVVTSNVAGVNISVEFLDSLVFIAPAGSNGTFNIKMEAYTIDHDEDDGATKTQTSGQAILTLEVDPVADIATIKTTQAKGFEDAGRDASGATSEALALSGGIDLNVTFFTSDKDGSESFDVTLSDIPNGAVIYYNGAILTPVAGTINIVNFDNDAEFKYVPTHNSNEDVTLKVTGETVDNRGQANEDRQAFTPKDIVVNIKGVADNVVDNDLNATTAVVDTDGTSHDYHYVAKEDAGNISLTDIFAGTPHSYDSDGSESLFITITNLGTDFDVSGAVFLGGSGTGREWVVNSNDFAGVSISKPANYSGEIDLKLGFQTVENDGSKKTHPSKDVNILVTPEIDGNVNKTATQNEDTIQTLSFNFSNGGDANESLEALQIDMDSVDNGVTLYSDGVEITANGWIDVTGVITATIPADSDTDYDFAIRYKMSDTTDDSTSYTDKSISDNSYDSTDTSWTLDTYMVDVKAVTDTATSSITLASDDTDKATVSGDDTNGYTLTVDKTNTTFDVGFKLTSDDVASEANSADDDGSEKVVSITISGVPEGVSIVGGTYAGDKLVNVGGTATIINSGSWTLAVTDAMLDADGALNNIGFMVEGEKVNFNNITTTGNIKITVGHQDGSSTTLTNSENFDFVVDGGFNGDSGVLKNDTAIPMDLALVSNSTQLREDTSFTLDSLVTANDGTTNGDSSKFAILISDLPTGYTISGVSDQTVTIDGVKYYAAYGDGDVTDVNTLLSNISVTPASNENTLVTEKVDFKIEVRTSISEENSDGAHQKSYSVDGKAGGFDAELAPVSDATTIGISGSDVAESATPAEQTITLDLSNSADGDRVVIKDGTLYVKFTESYTDGDAATKGTITYNGVDVSTLAVEDGYYKITGVSNDLNADNIIFKYTPPANHYGTLKIDSKIISSENPNPEKDLSGADYTTTQETTLATKTINVTPVNDGLSNLSLTSSTGLEDGMAELVLNVGALSDSTESISSITLQNIPYGYVVYYGADENNVSKATTSKLVGRDANGDYIYNITIPVDADGTLPDYIGVTAPIADKIGSDVDISDAKLVVVSGEGGSGKTQIVENINITWTAVADGLINMDPTNAIGDELSDVAINVNANVKDVDGSEIFTMTLKGLGVDASFKEAGVDATSVVYDASNDTYTISNISYENVNSITFVQKAFTGDVDVTLQSRESSNGDTSVVSTGSFTATVSAASATAGDDELLYYSGKDIDGLGGNDTLVMWPGQDINFNALGGDTFANIEKIDLGANGNHEISNLSLDDIMTITNGDASNHHDLTIVGDNGDSIRDVEFDIGTNDTQWTETGDMTDKVFEYSKNDGSASITLTVDEQINSTVM